MSPGKIVGYEFVETLATSSRSGEHVKVKVCPDVRSAEGRGGLLWRVSELSGNYNRQ